MPGMKRRNHRPVLPIWGYILLNLLVLGTFYGIYKGSVMFAAANNFYSVGLFPILATCYIAFLFVSIVDAIYDRSSRREERKAPDAVDSPPASASRETIRKPDQRGS
jgi:hypothetical protein